MIDSNFNNEKMQLLDTFQLPETWDYFFKCFLKTVHPVELAVRQKNKAQPEDALSAALQRTFFHHQACLGLINNQSQKGNLEWVPVIEAPAFLGDNKRWLFSDICLTPWVNTTDLTKKESWDAAECNSDQVRIEVKWHDKAAGCKEGELRSKIGSIRSKPELILTLVFDSIDSNFEYLESWENSGAGSIMIRPDGYKCIYCRKKQRVGYNFPDEYKIFWMIVHFKISQ